MALDFSLEILDTKKQIPQNSKENYFEPKILYPAKLIFKRETKYRYVWTYKDP